MAGTNIKTKDFSKQATSVEIEVNGFALNSKTGNATVVFKDENGNNIDRKNVDIPEEVFTTWGTDDSVIENYVFEQLGIEKAK